MIFNLKKEVHLRGLVFENIAKVLVRKNMNNNFVFMTKYFNSLDELVVKYCLNLSCFDVSLLNRINKQFHSIDLIGFELNNHEDRIVQDLLFYEVKTKSSSNSSRYDICASSSEIYDFLKKNGFSIFLVSFVIFENWNYSFNIHKLNLNKLRVYSKYSQIVNIPSS
jgi:hypothetical protein